MSLKFFITGTDTEVGKTYISVLLLKKFNQLKFSTLGIKPVSSGSFYHEEQLINYDAQVLRDYSSEKLPYPQINPFAFIPAIAPHIAAQKTNRTLSVAELINASQPAICHPVDICLIEGFGGWKAPLNTAETMADFVCELKLKTILVVGMRLGCLNHALLTHEAIQRDHVSLLGWIANCIDPNMAALAENLSTLQAMLPSPCLGIIRYGEQSSSLLNINKILEK